MEIKHKLDISDAVDAIAEKFKSSTKDVTTVEEKDDIDYNEFRFRIKTLGGTDINIPGAAIGFVIGAICAKGIINVLSKMFSSKD